MATATATAPITIGRINSSLYAGEPGFPTAQVCVDFARNEGGYWLIVIPHGYAGDPNPPSSLVGGTTSMWLLDQRLATWQAWRWNGTAFIPADFDQLGGFIAHGLQTVPTPAGSAGYGYDHASGLFGAASINASAVPGGGLPSVHITGYPSDGGVTPAHTWIVCEGDPTTGDPRTLINGTTFLLGVAVVRDQLNATGGLWTEVAYIGEPQTGVGNKFMLLGTNPTANTVQIQGITAPSTHDQTLQLQPSGGDTVIGLSAVTITEGGSVHAVRGKFSGPVRMMNGTEPSGSFNIWTGDGDVGVPGAKGMTITAVAATNVIDFQGRTIGPTVGTDTFDQNISLNASGGTVSVNGSPVRTFANTVIISYPPTGIPQSTGTAWGASINPATLQGKLTLTTTGSNGPSTLTGNVLNIPQYAGSGSGMIYPGAGIGISTGTGWGTSLDPATLATYPPTGIPQSNGTAWGASINPATLQGKLTLTTTGTSGAATLTGNALNIPLYTAPAQVYPGAGVGVSTGTAWGASIDPATIPLKNVFNTWTASQQFSQGIGPIFGGVPVSGFGGNGLYLGWNQEGTGRADFINQKGTGTNGFNWWDVTSAGVFTLMGTLTKTAFTITGALSANGLTIVNPATSGAPVTIQTPSITSGGAASIFIGRAQSPGAMLDMSYVEPGKGKIGVLAGAYATFDYPGNWTFSGTVTAAGKSFRIPHPLDETKDLVHSCLEGPEWGVYYRGEIVTANGTAEVTLPDYFEALTFPEDRSVQLTQVFEDGAVLTMLAASRIVGGKFTVHSSAPIATVAWQVNAVRRFGENKLEVVTAKAPTENVEEAKQESTNERKQRNPKRV